MKKLITIVASAVFATGFAMAEGLTVANSLENFENGSFAANLTDDGAQIVQGGDVAYWLAGDGLYASVLSYDAADCEPAQDWSALNKRPDYYATLLGYTNAKYLQMEGGTVYRTIKNNVRSDQEGEHAPGSQRAINDPLQEGVSVAGGDVYLDTMVKFSAYMDYPTNSSEIAALIPSGTRIAVWACVDSDDETVTNLYVSANKIEGADRAMTNYLVRTGFDCSVWHRLTIRSIAATAKEIGFVVYLDGDAEPLAYPEGVDVGFDPSDLKAAAHAFYDKRALFPSVSDNLIVTAAGAKGSGCLDEIVLTDVKPTFVPAETPKFTVVWDENVATIQVGDGEVISCTGAGFQIFDLTGATVTIKATYAQGYEGNATAAGTPFDVENGKTIEITSFQPAWELNGKNYPDFLSVLEDVHNGDTVKLLSDVSDGAYIDCEVVTELTIDLNGKTLTGVEGDYVIFADGVDLTIINTADTEGEVIPVQYAADPLLAAVYAASLDISGGKYYGIIESDNDPEVTGGLFFDPDYAAGESSVFYLDSYIDESVGYAAEGDLGWFRVGEAPTPVTKYDVQVVLTILNGTVVADKETAAAGETVTLTATPDSGYVLDSFSVNNGDVEVVVDGNVGTFTMPAAAVEVTATFTAIPMYTITLPIDANGRYTTTYRIGDGEETAYTEPVNVADGTTVWYYFTPEAGYTVEGVSRVIDSETIDGADIIINAPTVGLVTYTITYMNGESSIENWNGQVTVSYTVEDSVTLPTAANIALVGVTFGGWYANANLEGDEVIGFAAGQTGDKTFYGKFEAVVPSVVVPDPINAGSAEQKAAYIAWADANGVTGAADVNADAFAIGVTGDDIAAADSVQDAAMAKLSTLITAEMVAKIAADGLSSGKLPTSEDFGDLEDEYPNANFTFVEAQDLESTETAKFYKLSATFKPAN